MSMSLVHTTYQPIVFVIDVSPSMKQPADPKFRPPIDDLNSALACFYNDLCDITHCAVVVLVITFADDVKVEHDFKAVGDLSLPQWSTRGNGTNLGGAIGRALDEVQARREYLRQTGLQPKQPWVVCPTDGQPNTNTCPGFDTRLGDLVKRKKCLFLPIAVGGYTAYDELERLSPDQKPVVVSSTEAGSLTFKEYFKFLSQSMASGQVPDHSLLQSHE